MIFHAIYCSKILLNKLFTVAYVLFTFSIRFIMFLSSKGIEKSITMNFPY